mmetsp:Transcript_76381/g.218758  ORF Transcript_76381/g.218758 Transcript_76381/m.218758 type:complete len:201 (+) Transcript_76381:96-698(+)
MPPGPWCSETCPSRSRCIPSDPPRPGTCPRCKRCNPPWCYGLCICLARIARTRIDRSYPVLGLSHIARTRSCPSYSGICPRCTCRTSSCLSPRRAGRGRTLDTRIEPCSTRNSPPGSPYRLHCPRCPRMYPIRTPRRRRHRFRSCGSRASSPCTSSPRPQSICPRCSSSIASPRRSSTSRRRNSGNRRRLPHCCTFRRRS